MNNGMLKKILAVTLALAMLLCTTACSTARNLLPLVNALTEELGTEHNMANTVSAVTSAVTVSGESEAESSGGHAAESAGENGETDSEESITSQHPEDDRVSGAQAAKPIVPETPSSTPASSTSSTGGAASSAYVAPSLTVDTAYLTLSDASAVVYVTLVGYDSINVSYYSDVTDCSWGDWSGDTIPLYITPMGPGYDTVEIFTDNYELYATVEVTVEGSYSADPAATLSVDVSDITLGNAPVTVYVTYTGYEDIYYYSYNGLVECSWGEWNGDTVPLTITPTANGSDRVEIYTDGYTLATSVYLYIEGDFGTGTVTLTADVTEIDPLTAPYTVYITYNGTENLNWSTDYGEVTCAWGEPSGDVYPLTITPVGSSVDFVNIYTDSGDHYIYITVYVEGENASYEADCELSVDTSYVELTDSPVTVYITYTGDQSIYWESAYGEVTCTWGEWNDDTVPLTITPVGSGLDYVDIYSDEGLYTWVEIYVDNGEYVEGGELYVDTSYVELTDSPVTVYVTLTGYDSINVYYSGDVVDCNWGEWSGDVVPLTITPVGAGECTIEIYTDNYELYTTVYAVVG